MKTSKTWVVVGTVVAGVAWASSPARATEGYFSNGYGAIDKMRPAKSSPASSS